jgi:hypothetical protein
MPKVTGTVLPGRISAPEVLSLDINNAERHQAVERCTSAASAPNPNAWRPRRISKAMTPRAHASTTALATTCLKPLACAQTLSGATQGAVNPTGAGCPIFAAMPKSMSTQEDVRGNHMTFPGFRSQCTYPDSCKSTIRWLRWLKICTNDSFYRFYLENIHSCRKLYNLFGVWPYGW